MAKRNEALYRNPEPLNQRGTTAIQIETVTQRESFRADPSMMHNDTRRNLTVFFADHMNPKSPARKRLIEAEFRSKSSCSVFH